MTSKPVAFLLADLGVIQSHSRPHVSNDNPYSEAQFKTLKYRPGFPARFASIEAARAHCQAFFPWYNTQHRHSGLGLHTAADVHHGTAAAVRASRARVLAAAYRQHPGRFVSKPPRPATTAHDLLDQPTRERSRHSVITPQRRPIQVDRFRQQRGERQAAGNQETVAPGRLACITDASDSLVFGSTACRSPSDPRHAEVSDEDKCSEGQRGLFVVMCSHRGGRAWAPRTRGRTMTNADHKAAIRERMASTGENYTTAKRAIELARLTSQSEQLDGTLADQRTRTLNERFDTVAEQLGSDKSPAVRLAGVYAMAGLADDWQDHRQTCVDVLCAYLRMPYEPEPGDDAPVEERLAWQASREVRHTVIRVITGHLNGTAPVSWCGLNFDFVGAVFDGGDFSGAKFSGGKANFAGAEFAGGTVNFAGAEFAGGTLNFAGAKFSGARVNFFLAKFFGAMVDFAGAKISGGTVNFGYAGFSGGPVNFSSAKFSGAEVDFFGSKFIGESPKFTGVGTSGGMVFFHAAEFSGGTVSFSRAEFSSETVDFAGAEFSGGTVSFAGAEFSGGTVSFAGAEFPGGTVDFSRVASWTQPPDFGSGFDMSHPPAGVMPPTATSPSPDSPVP